MTSYYAQPVPGSAALVTRRRGVDRELDAVERLAVNQFERRQVGPDELGRAVVRDQFVAVQREVFDHLLPRLTPIEQVLYLQLYRRSYGEERNFCRVSRRELCLACRLSLRRFNRALAGLVRFGAVKLVQRDRRGTCYRILLPREIAGKKPGREVLLGRLAAAALAAQEQAPADGRHKVQSFDAPLTVGQVVEQLVQLLPRSRRQACAIDLLQELTAALEEGADLASALAVSRQLLAGGRFDSEQFSRGLRRQLQLAGEPG